MTCSMRSAVTILLVVGLLWPRGGEAQVPGRTMTISAIFDDDGDKFLELAFRHAVEVVNRNRSACIIFLIFSQFL